MKIAVNSSSIRFMQRLVSRTMNTSSSVNGGIVNIVFIEGREKEKIHAKGEIGKRVLDVALDHNVDIEGACGGELACSTCHVICSQEVYDKLPPKKEEEEDMLDLAWGRTNTSRLCCQIKLDPMLEGAEFTVPVENT